MTDKEHELRPGAAAIYLLGDFDRVGGRQMRLKSFVTLGEALGIPGPTMRVTLARLRERGWFEVHRKGRESIYRLTPACLRVLAEGGQRFLHFSPEPWTGEWDMAIFTVPDTDRRTRDELRKQLVWLGYGPLAPATWINPHRRLDDLANAASGLTAAKLTLLTSRTSGLAADRALALRCWDLDEIAARYNGFIAHVRRDLPAYESGVYDGTTALAKRIELLHRFRRTTTGDPRLPEELQPAGWPGIEAQRLFERAHHALADSARELYADELKPAL